MTSVAVVTRGGGVQLGGAARADAQHVAADGRRGGGAGGARGVGARGRRAEGDDGRRREARQGLSGVVCDAATPRAAASLLEGAGASEVCGPSETPAPWRGCLPGAHMCAPSDWAGLPSEMVHTCAARAAGNKTSDDGRKCPVRDMATGASRGHG